MLAFSKLTNVELKEELSITTDYRMEREPIKIAKLMVDNFFISFRESIEDDHVKRNRKLEPNVDSQTKA